MNEVKNPYRWKILAAMMVGIAAINFAILLVPAMAVKVIEANSLSQMDFAAIASVAFLAGAIIGIPCGIWADKKGVRSVVIIGLVLSVVGCGLRIFATGFALLFICNFLIGVGSSAIDANAAKFLGQWFPPKDMGTAMGIFIAATTIGTSAAFATGNLFPSIQMAFGVSAGVMVVALICWLALAKNPSVSLQTDGAPMPPALPKGSWKLILKSKYMWISCLSIFLILGGALTINNFLTQALIMEKGVPDVQAGFITTIMNVCLMIGGMFWGIITDKTQRLTIILVFVCIFAGFGYYLAWLLPFGSGTYIILALTGLICGGTIPLAKTMIPKISFIGEYPSELIGTAGGIHSAFQNAGAFIIPTYIVAGISGQNFMMTFTIGFIIFALAGLINLFIPELGGKGKIWKKIAAQQEK